MSKSLRSGTKKLFLLTMMIFAFVLTSLPVWSVVRGESDFPPTMDMLFGENVDVIHVEPIADNVNRILHVYVDDRWHVYPYPEALTAITTRTIRTTEEGLWIQHPYVAARPDGSLLVIENGETHDVFRAWALNPLEAGGGFQPIDMPCGANEDRALFTLIMYDETPLERAWVYAEDGENTVLCHLVTGKHSPPLPDDLLWGAIYTGSIEQPDVSPDGAYVVLRGCCEDHSQAHFVYGYDVGAEQFYGLGKIGSYQDNLISFEGWLEPPLFVMRATALGEWQSRRLYVGSVVSVGSLRLGMSKLRFDPRIIVNPPTLENMPSVMSDGFTQGPCVLRVYDAETRLTWSYDTGRLCAEGLPIPNPNGENGDRLYRADDSLIVFNHITRKQRVVYRGEIEGLGAISPTGAHLLIGLGHNSVVDSDDDPDLNYGYTASIDRYAVIRLEDGAILGRVSNSAVWLSDRHLAGGSHLFEITGDALNETVLPGVSLYALPARQQVLVQTSDDEVVLYDVKRGDSTPLMRSVNGMKPYLLDAGDHWIQLALYDPQQNNPALRFTLRLPLP